MPLSTCIKLPFHWVNVFTTQQDRGNPLPVFLMDSPSEGDPNKVLSKASMQAIALMMNQSETVFIENSMSEVPYLHIYTPMQELPFAGHPIIGALGGLNRLGNDVVQSVETLAGNVAIKMDNAGVYWLKTPKSPTMRESSLDIATTAEMLNLPTSMIKHAPVWVNSGSEQLLVELESIEALNNIEINLERFAKHATLYAGRTMLYLWTRHEGEIEARYLYLKNGALGEDSGTGSACANLGGYQLLMGNSDLDWTIQQARMIEKDCTLYLRVTNDHEIWIGGANRWLGSGELNWEEPEKCHPSAVNAGSD